MTEALEGIRVIDLCRGYPPAFATMHLADFGADVIRIDPTGLPPALPTRDAGEKGLAYRSSDRNKRGMKINFKSEEGKKVAYNLVKTADVLIENSRPGTMERLGMGYEVLKDINPRLIYCAVSGYGQDGPYRDGVGHDLTFLAVTGALSLLGPKGGPPIKPTGIIGDFAGSALHAMIAILLALRARDKTGKGQFIDISYTDAVFSLLSFEIGMHFLTGKRRMGETTQTGGEPCAAVYETKDGKYFTISFLEPQFWVAFCRAIGREDLASKQWPQNDKEKEELFASLSELFLTRTRDEWWEWAKGKQLMLAPVYYLEEALQDPHMIHRGMVMELDHPTLGKVTQVGSPFKLKDTPARFKDFGHDPGHNTDEILQEVGYKKQQIEELRKCVAIE